MTAQCSMPYCGLLTRRWLQFEHISAACHVLFCHERKWQLPPVMHTSQRMSVLQACSFVILVFPAYKPHTLHTHTGVFAVCTHTPACVSTLSTHYPAPTACC
jgi:hypothetical protein